MEIDTTSEETSVEDLSKKVERQLSYEDGLHEGIYDMLSQVCLF